MKTYAVILASGTGKRTGLTTPKQFLKIGEKTIIEHTINAFEQNEQIDEIIIVTNPDYINLTKNLIKQNCFKKIKTILPGGKTRQESSYIGICAIKEDDGKVLIHDAARPFVSTRIINECIKALDTYKAVNVAIESTDTILEVNDRNIIEGIPERKYLKHAQTPQGFNLKLIKKAHELAKNLNVTDDSSLVVKLKLADVYVISGEESNIKITHPTDFIIADAILKNTT